MSRALGLGSWQWTLQTSLFRLEACKGGLVIAMYCGRFAESQRPTGGREVLIPSNMIRAYKRLAFRGSSIGKWDVGVDPTN